jgi:hypothetical protein
MKNKIESVGRPTIQHHTKKHTKKHRMDQINRMLEDKERISLEQKTGIMDKKKNMMLDDFKKSYPMIEKLYNEEKSARGKCWIVDYWFRLKALWGSDPEKLIDNIRAIMRYYHCCECKDEFAFYGDYCDDYEGDFCKECRQCSSCGCDCEWYARDEEERKANEAAAAPAA